MAENDLHRICAWCGKDMGMKPGGEGVTHGMCDECVLKFEQGDANVKNMMLSPSEQRRENARSGAKNYGAENSKERDYATIISVARKIPENILQEDPKLLMWYDQALTRSGEEV